MSSKILDDILSKKNRTANLQVVFVDVGSYSKRRSQTQAEVIDLFMNILSEALKSISQIYIDYTQSNGLNFQYDVIKLPAGDGAAIVFPFDGLHDIHLIFSKEILRILDIENKKNICDKFNTNGWCNCHPNFNLSIGVSEGKGIVYKDVNDNYNIAGNVINMAARVMGKADRNQIMFTEEAYKQLIDIVDDPHLDEKFTCISGVEIKHDIEINIYQYVDESCPYVNAKIPKELDLAQRTKFAIDKFKSAANIPAFPQIQNDKEKFVTFIEQMGDLFGGKITEPRKIE